MQISNCESRGTGEATKMLDILARHGAWNTRYTTPRTTTQIHDPDSAHDETVGIARGMEPGTAGVEATEGQI